MQKLSHDQAFKFINSFFEKVEFPKTAEESPENVGKDGTGPNPAGTVAAKVESTKKNTDENTKTEAKASQGEFGKEKKSDVVGAVPGTSVENKNSQVGSEAKPPVNDINAKNIEAGSGEELAEEMDNMKAAEETELMHSELARAKKLGDLILNKVASLQAAAPAARVENKLDKEASELQGLMKQAADEAYHDFVTSYQYGLIKRAEDEASIQKALGIDSKMAAELLDQIAAENPEAVLPAEAGAAGMEGAAPGAAMAPEAGAGGDENVAKAEQLIEELKSLGVTEEEIAQILQEIAGEEAQGGAGGGVAAEAAQEGEPAAEEMAEQKVAMEKAAAERKGVVKDILKAFRASL